MKQPEDQESKLKKALDTLQTRLELLSRISCSSTEIETEHQLQLKKLLDNVDHIINIDLPNIAKKCCPNDFAEILHNMRYRFEEFSYFCFYPELGQKNIVGIGGGFSAGKSSFINRLINEKFLMVNINPTTSIPTYLYYGQEEKILASNIFQKTVQLSQEEFKIFTHKEEKKYKTNFGKMLQKVKIQIPRFKWKNLAILDTPGYSKAKSETDISDIEIAKQQLKSVNYIIWIISAEKGTITEEDINFLAELNPDSPRIILINKSDKKPSWEIENIVELVKKIAIMRNLNVLDVIPVCSHFDDQDYSLDKVMKYLEQWDQEIQQLDFMYYFKKPFYQYSSYLLKEKKKLKGYFTLMNNIAWKVEDQYSHYANDLKEKFKIELAVIEEVEKELKKLEDKFFQEVQKISVHIQVPFFEPHYFELAEPESCGRLLQVLEKMTQGREVNHSNLWKCNEGQININRLNSILQQLPIKNYADFQQLS